MLDYMRAGGFGMWLILAGFLLCVGVAVTRPREARPTILVAGCIFSLIAGMFGMATGMVAVAHNYSRFPDHVAAVAEGLGELSNNGSFAAILAAVQGVAALVLGRAAKE